MTSTQPILSLKRLRRYRLEAGLSERALARAAAMTSGSITAFEEGRNHHELSLSHIVRIARALNVSPSALFEPVNAPEAQPDDVLIEAALANTGSYTRTEQLARGLDWTLDRTVAALDHLRRRLEGTGQRLATRNGKVQLKAAAGVLTDAQERDVAAAVMHERGLTLSLAQLLRQAVDGRVDAAWHRRANANDLLVQGSLLRLEFAEFRDDQLKPTADVIYGLAPLKAKAKRAKDSNRSARPRVTRRGPEREA